jgi:uncharacterized protein YuzE
MEAAIIKDIKKILPWFIRHKNIWSDYDLEADTLYLHFKKPNHADHSEMTEDDIIVRYEKDEIIGMTILHASKRKVII